MIRLLRCSGKPCKMAAGFNNAKHCASFTLIGKLLLVYEKEYLTEPGDLTAFLTGLERAYFPLPEALAFLVSPTCDSDKL